MRRGDRHRLERRLAMTRIFTRTDVENLLTMGECIEAVESVFRRFGEGSVAPPSSLGVHVDGGGFHIKAASVDRAFAAKLNANFPANPQRGLPTIQGVLILADPECGTPLAIMDSGAITTMRTAAASAVAAKYLARKGAGVMTICGLGVQGRAHRDAISRVRKIAKVFAIDVDNLGDLDQAIAQSDIVVTTTPSKRPFIERRHLHDGLFIAAVGADNPEKSEIAPDAMAAACVVVDVLEQAATMGDLHHAIAAGAMFREDVYADLGTIVAGRKAVPDGIVVFDSTGTALQDVVAAELVYRRGIERNAGIDVILSEAKDLKLR
jgi:alanine dehydrogenase